MVEEFTETLRSWLPVPMSALPLIGRDEDPEPALSRSRSLGDLKSLSALDSLRV
jgi:hypothetical protein